MNREIKFKAKRVDNGEWIIGYYSMWLGDHCIFPITPMGRVTKIHPSTVCQYTGLKDSNGIEIYEGDRVSIRGLKYNVMWVNELSMFTIGYDDGRYASYPFVDYCTCTVTGNIHD